MLYLEFQVLPDWRSLVTTVYPSASACCFKMIKDMRADSNSHLSLDYGHTWNIASMLNRSIN